MSAYFAPIVSRPTVITAPGEYTTRSGERVTVTKTSRLNDFDCFGVYADSGIAERWHRSGRLYAGVESRNDIVGSA